MPKKVNKAKEVKSNSDVFEIYLGTFIDNAFTWYSIKKFKDLKSAYKEFKNYVNTQLKYTDEELQKVWDTGRLDIELRQGSRLLNWVGIYSRKVANLDEKEEKEARKGKIKKDSVTGVDVCVSTVKDGLNVDMSEKITEAIFNEAAKNWRHRDKRQLAKDLMEEAERFGDLLSDENYKEILEYAADLKEEADDLSKPKIKDDEPDSVKFNTMIETLPDYSEIPDEQRLRCPLVLYIYDTDNEVLTVEDCVDADYVGDILINGEPKYKYLATCVCGDKEYIIGKKV